MRVFTKKFLISFLAIFLGISVVSCKGDETTTETTPNDSILPELSDPDSVFLSTDDYEITYQDLYDEVKINDGLNHILNIVDTDILSSYIAAVTQQEIDDRIKELTYGTSDPEELAEFTADELAEMELEYEESMYLLGYSDWEEEYARLVVARENYTTEQILSNENFYEAWYAGPTAVAEYYDANYEVDINTIKIRFMSEADAKRVLTEFNLVSLGTELRLYTGSTPLAQVPSSQLNENNTRELSDTEILEQFILMYNYIYGDFRDEIATDATFEDLLALDDLVVTREDLSTANSSLDNFVYETLGTYDEYVNNDDDLLYYTYEPVEYYSSSDTSYYMILNLQKPEKADLEDFLEAASEYIYYIGSSNNIYNYAGDEVYTYNADDEVYTFTEADEEDDVVEYVLLNGALVLAEDTTDVIVEADEFIDDIDALRAQRSEAEVVALIGQEIYDEMEQEIIDMNLSTSSFVSNRLVTLRQEHGFELYDYYLGIDYQNIDGDFELNEEGHETYVCTYDDQVITADDLLEYALEFNVTLYAIYAAQVEAVVAAHYEDIYCTDAEETCDYNVLTNDSERMTEHSESYTSLQTQFEESYYASYYEFEEYLYLAYGVTSEYEMMYQYYVKSTLQPYLIYDEIVEDYEEILAYLLELSQPYYDNYFSLEVEHLLIYVDRNENGEPDDYEDFYAELEDTTVFDQKLADFEAAIRAYLAEDDENDFASLVDEYSSATRNDVTWGEFKSYGFYIITEDLGDLTYADSYGVYEQSFVDELVALNQDYLLTENENEDYLLSDALISTSFGVHLIQVEKGNNFDKPSAAFQIVSTSSPYSDDLENTEDQISLAQLRIYADYRFTELAYGTGNFETIYGLEKPEIPDVVLDAIEEFQTDLYDALYVVGYLNTIIIEQFHEADYENENSTYVTLTEAEFLEICDQVSNIYMRQIFADYVVDTEE